MRIWREQAGLTQVPRGQRIQGQQKHDSALKWPETRFVDDSTALRRLLCGDKTRHTLAVRKERKQDGNCEGLGPVPLRLAFPCAFSRWPAVTSLPTCEHFLREFSMS